eukprot:4055847-Alexandrium_andersonii.AAC.1
MSASLVGSEMCIRDRSSTEWPVLQKAFATQQAARGLTGGAPPPRPPPTCLLYTSDAADDM